MAKRKTQRQFVLQVIFEEIDDNRSVAFELSDCEKLFGEPPLRKPSTAKRFLPVMVWSVDNITTDDTRWIAFGPYASRAAAQKAQKRIAQAVVLSLNLAGDRYHTSDINDFYGYCRHLYSTIPCSMYTDG